METGLLLHLSRHRICFISSYKSGYSSCVAQTHGLCRMIEIWVGFELPQTYRKHESFFYRELVEHNQWIPD